MVVSLLLLWLIKQVDAELKKKKKRKITCKYQILIWKMMWQFGDVRTRIINMGPLWKKRLRVLSDLQSLTYKDTGPPEQKPDKFLSLASN